jgi:hypothetical protein
MLTSVAVRIQLRSWLDETELAVGVYLGTLCFCHEFSVQAYGIAESGANDTSIDLVDHGRPYEWMGVEEC